MIIEEFKKHVYNIRDGKPLGDISKIKDPFTKEVRWDPVKRGGTNIITRHLRRVGHGRLEFVPSFLYIFFSLPFIIAGSATILMALSPVDVLKISEFNIMLIVGICFFIGGVYLLNDAIHPIVFDKGEGCYRKGWRKSIKQNGRKKLSTYCKFDDIHSIQLLSEYSSGSPKYYSYELNLVLKNGERINVVDHGGRDLILSDARLLSRFLKVPLWNGFHD